MKHPRAFPRHPLSHLKTTLPFLLYSAPPQAHHFLSLLASVGYFLPSLVSLLGEWDVLGMGMSVETRSSFRLVQKLLFTLKINFNRTSW